MASPLRPLLERVRTNRLALASARDVLEATPPDEVTPELTGAVAALESEQDALSAEMERLLLARNAEASHA